MLLRALLIAGLSVATLAACSQRTRPPGDKGVCFHVVSQPGGELKYNPLPGRQPDLEHCAAALEAMRIRFLTMGGSVTEILGAYQTNYIFVQREGIFTGPTLEGARFPALVRSGDGRLVVPGAMPQR